jgi:predicted RNA-binding Zn ribbon-like protein
MNIALPSGLPLDLRARTLCLEFTNTVGDHASAQPREFLNSYADLLKWAEAAGVVTPAGAARLGAEAARQPAKASAALRQALRLREAMYRTLVAHLHGNPPEGGDVEIINTALRAALGEVRLENRQEGHRLAWGEPKTLEALAHPAAVSAADLLSTPELLERVGQCADADGCGWLFLDLTKNRSRRWCDMRDCGNRAKARRYYRRTRG